MDNDQFLQHLRELNLDEGRAFIQAHASELANPAAFGELLADEALDQLYTNPSVSLKLAEHLIFFGKYVQHTPSYALGLKAKGDALKAIGLHQAALEALDAAGEEFLCQVDEGNWARSRISWIISCAWLGRVEEALQEATRARNVFLKLGEYYWVYVIDSNMAAIYSQIGRYQEALDIFTNIMLILPTMKDQSTTFINRAIAIAEANQGEILTWLGKFEQAYHLLLQAQASFITLEETSLIIHLEIRLADLDYIQGYYGSALRHYYQASDSMVQKHADDPLILAELKLKMANCLVKLNRAQEACHLAAEATEVFRQLDVSLDTGDALREYANTLVATGKTRDALLILDEAETLFTRGGFDRHAFTTKLQQAEILLEMGSDVEAYNQADLIKDYFEARGLVARYIRANLVMAGALLESAQQAKVQQKEAQQATLLQEAIPLCKRIALQAHRHNLQEEVYKSQYLLGRLFALQENIRKAARHYAAAIVQIERILDNLAYDLSPSFLHTTWAVYEDMIDLCLHQSQVESAFSYLERARSMALHQYINKSIAIQDRREERDGISSSSVSQINSASILRMQQELKDLQEKYRRYSTLLVDIDTLSSLPLDQGFIQNELKQCEAQLSELFERLHLYQSDIPLTFPTKRSKLHNTKHLNIKQLQQHLSPEQILIAYFLYKGRLVIFAVTSDQLMTFENPNGGEQLEQLLPLLHAHLQPGGWPDIQRPPQQAIRRLLNKLYNLLIAPVASLLPPSSGYLTIVPYGSLHKLPFQALYDGSHFLVENFQINYLPATNMFMHLDSREIEQTHHFKGAISSSKAPLVFGYSGNGNLQYATDEAKTLATLLDGRCYLEKDATIAQLIRQAPGSPVIHIATHGHSRLDAPNFSYVLLADGQLNAIDAFSLNLRGCELVTLSGCETGLALSSGGDEQLGLGRAFLAAGAESLVISLWSVEDNATNELMQIFYQRLLSGDTKVQALRAAQCSLLHHASPIYSHPYFWAAFRLVGDTGNLHTLKAKENSFAIENEPPKNHLLNVSLSGN